MAPTEIYTLSLHDALPIFHRDIGKIARSFTALLDEHAIAQDRKSTRLNSSHLGISYAVFCLKKKIIESQVETHKLRQDTVTIFSASITLYVLIMSADKSLEKVCVFFFLMLLPPPTSTLFPYTTLFR